MLQLEFNRVGLRYFNSGLKEGTEKKPRSGPGLEPGWDLPGGCSNRLSHSESRFLTF